MPNAIPWWASPLLSTILAVAVAWVAISFDRRKTVNQELIRKRIAVYDQMAPKLNDILCFFLCIGSFRSLPPSTIIAHKRELDRSIDVYEPIFSPALKRSYDGFIALCFIPYGGGAGRPALIAADARLLEQEWGDEWQADWKDGLVEPRNKAETRDVQRLYDALMDQFARELGAGRRHRRFRRG